MKLRFGMAVNLVCLSALMSALLAACGSGMGESVPAQTTVEATATADANADDAGAEPASVEIAESEMAESEMAESEVEEPEETTAAEDPTEMVGGASLDDAVTILPNIRYSGTYQEVEQWFAFTTGTEEDVPYTVTLENLTVGSKTLYGYVVDEFGNSMKPSAGMTGHGDHRFAVAGWDGTASYSEFDSLKPNSTYYIRLQGDSKADFSLLVTTPGLKGSAYSTSNSIEESVGTLGEDEVFYTGTNQNFGPLLKPNVWYQGKYEDGFAWVAFHTNEEEDAEYTIALENLTVGSKTVYGYLFDEIGRAQKPSAGVTGYGDWRFAQAGQDGTVSSSIFRELEPNTTYRIRIQSDSKADYRIMIGVPESEKPENMIEEMETEEEPIEETVFEVPFELNETQVRFKAESDKFIDPVAVEEALAPVAEIILSHPEHPNLLAGTTATDGDQAARVELSERRAAAVKKVLVEK